MGRRSRGCWARKWLAEVPPPLLAQAAPGPGRGDDLEIGGASSGLALRGAGRLSSRRSTTGHDADVRLDRAEGGSLRSGLRRPLVSACGRWWIFRSLGRPDDSDTEFPCTRPRLRASPVISADIRGAIFRRAINPQRADSAIQIDRQRSSGPSWERP